MMLPLLLALGLLLIGTVLLIVGADWFLDGAAEDRCEAIVKAQTTSTEEDQGISGESQVT